MNKITVVRMGLQTTVEDPVSVPEDPDEVSSTVIGGSVTDAYLLTLFKRNTAGSMFSLSPVPSSDVDCFRPKTQFSSLVNPNNYFLNPPFYD